MPLAIAASAAAATNGFEPHTNTCLGACGSLASSSAKISGVDPSPIVARSLCRLAGERKRELETVAARIESEQLVAKQHVVEGPGREQQQHRDAANSGSRGRGSSTSAARHRSRHRAAEAGHRQRPPRQNGRRWVRAARYRRRPRRRHGRRARPRRRRAVRWQARAGAASPAPRRSNSCARPGSRQGRSAAHRHVARRGRRTGARARRRSF